MIKLTLFNINIKDNNKSIFRFSLIAIKNILIALKNILLRKKISREYFFNKDIGDQILLKINDFDKSSLKYVTKIN